MQVIVGRSIWYRVWDVVIIGLLALLALVMLYPVVYVFVNSVSQSNVPNPYYYLWPSGFTLAAYRLVVSDGTFLRSVLNSMLYAGFGAALSVVLTLLTAYPLSMRSFPFRRTLTLYIVFTLVFTGGLIPNYLLVRQLGLINTPFAIILPGALTAFNVLISRAFFESNVPEELRDAARIDGANEWTILLRIAAPLSKPIVAVVGLISAVGIWNSYFYALIYLNNQNLYPVSLYLYNLITGAQLQQSIPGQGAEMTSAGASTVEAATLVLAMLPIVCLYPFLQRYFVRGMLLGALHG